MNNDHLPIEEDKFSIAFRLLGNEIFAMDLMSKSRKRNWVVFGIIILILMTIFVQQLLPLLLVIAEIM